MSIFVTKKVCSLLIVLTYFTCFLITPSQSCWFTTEWTVYVYNGIPDSIIDVHVKSGDDDLGHHNITSFLGYKFKFCDSLFGTLFTGDFSYKSRSAHFHVFDDEILSIIGGMPGESSDVFWLLKQDGYYLSRKFKSSINDPAWEFRGKWN
ncbi:hypothetical protein L1987_42342 [Smallanthus sonchifolius]|uniref:Uncharacterized protein n=1 Tax=Smallanthus sonchifolius TaxID=185202 RepID=A0ACB9GJK6_9ASTR|nr:hypothetical protein L1987_42342 [Smallanthus sonchifolius]